MIARILLLSLALFFSSCGSDVPEFTPSRILALKAQNSFSSGDYASLEAMFAEEFAEGESSSSRAAKFKTLNEVIGKSLSCEVADSSLDARPGEVARITYTIASKNVNVNSLNTFVIVKQGGDYKIAMMDVQAVKQ